MPVLNVHLVASRYSDAQLERFMSRATGLYAEVLDSPPERIRIILSDVDARHFCIGGERAVDANLDAPFFEVFLLAGRPPEHRTRLLVEITELLVSELGAPRELIRGCCRHVDPEDWVIAGVPAAQRRAVEIARRRGT